MKKRLLVLAALATTMVLASCGSNQENDTLKTEVTTAVEVTTEAAPEATTETAAEATTEEAEMVSGIDHSVKREISVDFDKLSQLSNSASEYGFSNKWRDDLNRPEDLADYDEKYGKYSAYNHIDTEDKVIYLTMDEGYENGYTPTILDTLKEKDVKATFFVTEQFYDEHPELIQRMIDEGHTVGNHSSSHPASGMPSLGLQGEYEDIMNMNDKIYETFGYQMNLFRFPAGNSSTQAVALLQEMGYSSIFWSFAYYDYDPEDQMDPAEALQQTMDYIHPGAIYLLHAISATNTEILGDFIDGAREKGYEFGILEEAIME